MELGGTEEILFALGRLLFGATLAFMGLNHFMQLESMTGYAQHKGLPAAKAMVLLSGLVLLAGGIGIVVGVFPVISGLLLAGFLLIAAVSMHDFWAVGEEQQQAEMTNFLKNIALAGGALAFAAVGTLEWPYSISVGLF